MLQVNDHVTIQRAVTTIKSTISVGETGIIVDVDPDTGDILMVNLDRQCWRYRHWLRNMVPIASADADALKLIGHMFPIDRTPPR
jgi:hypothetical protein